jgi:hypothetical protein
MSEVTIHPFSDHLVLRIPLSPVLRQEVGSCGVGDCAIDHQRLTESAIDEIKSALANIARNPVCKQMNYASEWIDGRLIRVCYPEIVPCDHGD